MTEPAASLLTPADTVVALIDHQPSTGVDVQSIDRGVLINNTAGLAKSAKVFDVPVVLSTIVAERGGPIFPEVTAAFPGQEAVDRTNTNAWEDAAFVAAVEATGRRKLVIAGLWTEVCAAFTALSARAAGYEVYVCTDACGGVTVEAHEMAVLRMTQAGIIPVTWLQVLSELQRDWNNTATVEAAVAVSLEHGGGVALRSRYGMALSG